MCADSHQGKDACKGDSGGPLIKLGNSAVDDIVLGVVSWGVGCGINPGVYARISAQREWIDRVVSAHGGKMCDNNRESVKTSLRPTQAPSTMQHTDNNSKVPTLYPLNL